MVIKNAKKQRKLRISSIIKGTADRPRLSVFRSNKYMHAQLINDQKHITLCGVSEKNITGDGKKTEKAKKLGIALADLAKKHNVTKVVFDKGAYRYHGRVKALADGAREGGLQF